MLSFGECFVFLMLNWESTDLSMRKHFDISIQMQYYCISLFIKLSNFWTWFSMGTITISILRLIGIIACRQSLGIYWETKQAPIADNVCIQLFSYYHFLRYNNIIYNIPA